MSATAGTPTLAEVLRLVLESHAAAFHVALPGIVKSYDASTQTADVQPAVRRLVPTGDDDDPDVEEELPMIPSVPVVHPGGATWGLHVPVEAGDAVLLVFCDLDPAVFHRTGNESAPADHRTHHLAHAVAIPGFRTKPGAIPGTSGSNVTFKHSNGFGFTLTPTRMEVGGSSDAAALASKLDSLAASFNAHTHGGVTTGAGATGVPTVLTTPVPYASGSTKLKLGG